MNMEFGVDEEDLRKHEGSNVLHSFPFGDDMQTSIWTNHWTKVAEWIQRSLPRSQSTISRANACCQRDKTG